MDDLSGVDKRTLAVWRATNVVGWSLVALAAAWLVQLLILNCVYLLEQVLRWEPPWRLDLYVLIEASPVIPGAVVGVIVGSQVYRIQVAVAVSVAAVYIGVGFIQPFEHPLGPWPGSSWAAACAVLGAGLVAHLVSRKRPVALRGGRSPY